MNIPLYQDKTPTEPGQYLWRGAFTGDVHLITVIYTPSKALGFRDYLSVVEHVGQSVDKLSGFFSDKLEFTY